MKPLNGLGTACTQSEDCPTDQFCATIQKCVSCETGSKPDEDREKCTPTSMFYHFFQHPSKIFLIHLNDLGTECAKSTDCPTGQICDASRNKCVTCGEGTKPDDTKEKCIPGKSYPFFSTTIKYNFNTSEWHRYRMR